MFAASGFTFALVLLPSVFAILLYSRQKMSYYDSAMIKKLRALKLRIFRKPERIQYLMNGPQLLRERYEENTGPFFVIHTLRRRLFILRTQDGLQRLLDAPRNVISFVAMARETLQTAYLWPAYLGQAHAWPLMVQRTVRFIEKPLTASLEVTLPRAAKVAEAALQEDIETFGKISSDGWISIPLQKLVTRLTLRVFNTLNFSERGEGYSEFLDALSLYLPALAQSAVIVSLFPRIIRPFIARIVHWTLRAQERTITSYLSMVAQKRAAGNHVEQNDFLQLHLDALKKLPGSIDDVVREIKLMNCTVVPNMTQALSACLFELGKHPETVKMVRKEISPVVQWTVSTTEKLDILDSAMKESQRLHSLSALGMARIAVADYDFGNGLRVSNGDMVAVAADAIAHDSAFFERPDDFDGLRFKNLQDSGESDCRFSDSGGNIFEFGHGKHQCPGRFIVGAINKVVLSTLLSKYEIAAGEGGIKQVQYTGMNFEEFLVPNQDCMLLLRRLEG